MTATPLSFSERLRLFHWMRRWPGYGPLHQTLKMKILRAFFIPGARLIETGTSSGRTARAFAELGYSVDTIEVDEPTFQLALDSLRGQSKIRVHLGDSATILPALLAEFGREPALNFWLDGHYTAATPNTTGRADTPIRTELDAIAGATEHMRVAVAIDDFRLFGVDPAYPSRRYLVEWAEAARLHWYVTGDIFAATSDPHPGI